MGNKLSEKEKNNFQIYEKQNTDRLNNLVKDEIQITEKIDDTNNKHISIVLVGETGQGKSKFCNFVARKDNLFEVGNSVNSQTTEINIKDFKREDMDVDITMIDTPGLNDTEGYDEKYKSKLNQFLENNEVDSIILVQSYCNPRFKTQNVELLKDLIKLYKREVLHSHLSLLYTNYRESEDEEDLLKFETLNKSIFEAIKKKLNYNESDKIVLPIYFIDSKIKGKKADIYQNEVNDMIKQIIENRKNNGRLKANSLAEKIEKAGFITTLAGSALCTVEAVGIMVFPPSIFVLAPAFYTTGIVTGGGLIAGVIGKLIKNK